MAKKEFKGTKGIWYLQEFTDAYTNIIRCDKGKGFETIYIASTSQSTNSEERENAKLMAAAPDLLEALNDLIIGYEDIWKRNYKHAILTPEFRNAHKAISKALK